MWLVRAALRRPISVLVIVAAVAMCSVLALTRMPADIFPKLNLPVIYVAQPYGGMDPAQMEGYLVNYYEFHFLYIDGIKSVESKSIQGVGLLKLTFHSGTDMSQAIAETVSYVNRAKSFMPPGTVPPFVLRFGAGTVPVGDLVFSSPTRSVAEIQDLALFRVRPLFATLPGVSAPPPFGGNQRTIVITVNPDRLRAYRMTPEDVARAVAAGNLIIPAGNARIGELNRMVPMNSVVTNIQDLRDLPLRTGAGTPVLLRDVGTVADSSDIAAGYALVNDRKTVYLPVTKRSGFSTVTVVNEVKAAIPRFREVLPPDVKVSFEFDQSVYVKNALSALVREGLLGVLLTGLMVLLFVRDWRSSLIVVITIPFALLTAVVALWLAGQTINIMTLGGLALAVGILVDEATVMIENIQTHLARGEKTALAVFRASGEVIVPMLLSVIAVLAVFVPSFFMTGVSRSLFVPLSLAVGFAMLASYFLSSSLVPVLAVWILRPEHAAEHGQGRFERLRERYVRLAEKTVRHRKMVLGIYLAAAAAVIFLLGPRVGREIFPQVDTGQFQLRMRAPTGTRLSRTVELTGQVLGVIANTAGQGNVSTALSFVGAQPPTYPINNIYLWSSGTQEAVMLVSLDPAAHIRLASFQEELRRILPGEFPGCRFSFEAGDIVSRIMNFGAPTPVEVSVRGLDLSTDRNFASRIIAEMKEISGLRDLQYGEPLDYPTVKVDVNRERAGQLGVTLAEVGRALVGATYSTRFISPIYWADPKTGIGYQVQVQVPQARMNSIQDIENIPIMPGNTSHPLLGDVANVSYGTTVAEYDRFNMQREVTITANVAGEDLGRAAAQVNEAIRRARQPPRGVTLEVGGQIAPMQQTLRELGIGLLLAVIVIYLLLAANFESMRLALAVISTVPAAIAGVVIALLVSGTTLNMQSFMGAIMAMGVAVANAILLVTFAEQSRQSGVAGDKAAIEGARTRLRPILMTSMAMVAGMVPLALALGTGAAQTAPLGRAVIGGLLAATLATLFILPGVLAMLQSRRGLISPSLDPTDPSSAHWISDAPGTSEGIEGNS
ncbi:MAG TPA: efflux RND transporter permease subunit [Candidatus Acidoferrales bacterium]|nr:efflux RND transporter permease subunit [Candidatus Acidoferrales bacterium]